jgi:hypothetical protein
MPHARISITLPSNLVKAADQRASELQRSRSWILAEALRAFLDAAGVGAGQVREPAAPPYGVPSPGLGPYRLEQLKADLALTPEQRVLAASRSARVARLRRTSPARAQVIQFDRYEDYLDWKRREDIT